MANYKIGDIVTLKSGSEAMTVADEVPGGAVACRWQNRITGHFEEESFRPDMLELVKLRAHQSKLSQLLSLRSPMKAAIRARSKTRDATKHELELGTAGSARQST